jgi:hypothetical protein
MASSTPSRVYNEGPEVPFFVAGQRERLADVELTITSIGQTYPDVHQRFLGIDMATADDPTLYNDYRYRLLAEHSNASTPRTITIRSTTWRTLTRAGVDKRLTGGDVLAGMQNTIGGPRYDVGPLPMPAVILAIQRGDPIRLVGTMGEPNFNQQTGIRVNRASLYCFPFSSQAPHQQVQTYEGGMWVGDFDCYQGF